MAANACIDLSYQTVNWKNALSQTVGGCFSGETYHMGYTLAWFSISLLQINPMWTGDKSMPLRITVTHLLSVTRAAWNCNVMIDNPLHGTRSPLRRCYCWQSSILPTPPKKHCIEETLTSHTLSDFSLQSEDMPPVVKLNCWIFKASVAAPSCTLSIDGYGWMVEVSGTQSRGLHLLQVKKIWRRCMHVALLVFQP